MRGYKTGEDESEEPGIPVVQAQEEHGQSDDHERYGIPIVQLPPDQTRGRVGPAAEGACQNCSARARPRDVELDTVAGFVLHPDSDLVGRVQDRLPINAYDAVAGQQAGLFGGAVRVDGPDQVGMFGGEVIIVEAELDLGSFRQDGDPQAGVEQQRGREGQRHHGQERA